MKTALITGVCLLVLTFTITDALTQRFVKKQDVNCLNPGDDVEACVDAADATPFDKSTVCTSKCRSALSKYFEDCFDVSPDEFNEEYDKECSAAGLVATLFTLVSAVLVAVGN